MEPRGGHCPWGFPKAAGGLGPECGPVALSLPDPRSHVTRLGGTAGGNGGREELSGSRVLPVASEIPASESLPALPGQRLPLEKLGSDG